MRQVTRKGLMTMAAATGVIAAAGGYAQADSGAMGATSDSPGVLSGNTVQAPVNAPVNVCGNTVDVVGILNPAVGNSCANTGSAHTGTGGSGSGSSGSGSGSQSEQGGSGTHGGSGAHGGSGGAQAGGHTGGSPGIGSGNHVQAPIDVPVNVCGNSVNVVGVGNGAFGNDCESGPGVHHGTPPGGSKHQPGTPGGHDAPGGVGSQGEPVQADAPAPRHLTPTGASSAARETGPEQLAHTGGDVPLGLVLPAGAGALLAGTILYRRARQSV
ncbi:chaplin [Streptomyces sp. bgisy153]|uniref:chaplin n=1 Tax=Streptomyces sp. bgisy153 TaxID=3413793 RepID=UPI003D73D617